MSMMVNTNVFALNALRNAKSVGSKQAVASARLSSGLKINSAADDAAGMAISEKMKAQIRGMRQAQQNTEDGINLIKTMDGGMNEIQDMFIRQRELIIQGMNDTNSDEDRDKIQMEIDQLTAEIGAVADRVEYNKIPLLNLPVTGEWVTVPGGTYTIPGYMPSPVTLYSNFYMSNNPLTNIQLQQSIKNSTLNPGALQEYHYDNGSGTITTLTFNIEQYILSYDAANGEDFKDFVSNVLFADPNNIKPADAQYFAERTAAALQEGLRVATGDNSITISGVYDDADGRIKFGMTSPSNSKINCYTCWSIPDSNGFGHNIIHMAFEQQTAPGGVVVQPPYVPEKTIVVPDYTKWIDANSPLWIQNGANDGQGTFVDRYDCRPEALGTKFLFLKPFEVAEQSLIVLDSAFGKVNEYRGKAGAQQNRLEHTDNSLAVAFENLEQANSRIADTDMAKEMMELTKANILQQASVAMLAQASQIPQTVLQLLKV